MAVSACPPQEHLAAYGLGRLTNAGAADTVADHLAHCQTCVDRLAALSSDSFVGKLRQGPPPADAPPAGDLPAEFAVLSQYTDVRELGRGGMGVVYLALNRLLDRREVLKVLDRRHLNRPETKERFRQEIQSAARLQHPNVVTAYTVTEVGESVVFVMEYVPGDDLAKVVTAGGPLPVARACHYVWQAAAGLQHAHERGMTHRDIKPANLILGRDGKRAVVKVLDFGLAKVASEQTHDTGLTREGQMMGTPDYIAPEQTLDAARADIRADIYSLGCTLYHLLAGHPPFRGVSLADVLLKHHTEAARPLNLVRPEVPPELAAVAARMMAKSPDGRFQTPAEVAAALKPFLARKPVATPDPLPAAAGRRWRVGLAVAVGVLLVGLLAAWAGGALKVKTPNGTIVVENVPDDAVVELDGGAVAITRDGKTVTLQEVKDGEHTVKVTANGTELLSRRLTIKLGDAPVKVWYEPKPPKGPPPATDAPTFPTTDRVVHYDFTKHDPPGTKFKRQDGHCVLAATQFGHYGENICNVPKEFALEVVGRMRKGDASGWGVNVTAWPRPQPPYHGVYVRLTPAGEVAVLRGTFETDPKRADSLKPVKHAAVKAGEEYNRLLVVCRGRALRVYVNGAAAEAIELDRDISPGAVALTVDRTGDPASWVEVRTLSVWDLAPPKLAPPAGKRAATAATGRWSAKDGVLTQAADNGTAQLLFGDPAWKDYDFACKVRRLSGEHGVTVLFRVQGPGNRYHFQLGPYGNKFHELGGEEKGRWYRDINPLKGELKAGEWRTALIRVRGESVECSLDGTQLFKHTDRRFAAGGVGFSTWASSAEFKDVKITDPDGKVLWEGLPELSK